MSEPGFDPLELFGIRRGPGRRGPREVRPRPPWGRARRTAVSAVAILVVILVVAFSLIGLRVQYLFLDNLGHSNVFWTPLVAKLLCFLVGAAITGALSAAGIPAWRRAAASIDARGGVYGTGIGVAVAAVFGLGGGAYLASQWEAVLLYIHGSDFGASDPVFHQDYGFFVFALPVYDALSGLVWAGLIASLLVTAAVAAACAVAELIPEEVPFPLRPPSGVSPRQGLRIAVLWGGVVLAGIFVMAALGAHFAAYHLATSQHDGFVGPDATERDVVRPVLGALQWMALALALVTAALLVVRRRRGEIGTAVALLSLLGGWLVVAGLVRYVPPAVYAAVRVNPNAATLQLPPITDYLSTSRAAWSLEAGRDVDTRSFGSPPGSPPSTPTISDLAADPVTLANTRVQDLVQLPEVFNQLDKSRRSYQTYPKVSVDRYPSSAGETAVMLGPREIEEANIPSQSFTNQAFVFTHGAGIAAVSVNQLDAEGNPQILARIGVNGNRLTEQLSPGAPPDLEVSDPRIYCGLQTTRPVVVNTRPDGGHDPEFDVPASPSDLYTRFGNVGGGLAVPGAIDRLAISVDQFKGLDLLLTSSTQDQSRILLHREVTDRIHQVAPFLQLDSDPYVVADAASGHFVFVVDAYLKSADFPESFRMDDGTSYMRNAVKAVVDARTCKTTLYVVDPHEPLSAAYGAIYPGLLTPLSQMPASLRRHLRYPEDLFNAQTRVFTAAHIDPGQPSKLFAKTDLFRISPESNANYVELTLPGDSTPRFVLLQTLSPNPSGTSSATNLVEWFAAVCDYTSGDSPHPKLVAVPLAGGNVLGAAQFDNNINTNADISAQRTLLSQSGSKVVLGDIVVLPFNSRSFLYVRPLYVQAANGSFPQVRYVLAGTRDGVARGNDLAGALRNLFGAPVPGLAGGAASPGAPSPSPPPPGGPSASPPPPPGSTTLSPEEVRLLGDLLDAQAAAQRDLGTRDYAAYSRDQARVLTDIDRLRQLLGPGFSVQPSGGGSTGASPSPSGSPGPTPTP